MGNLFEKTAGGVFMPTIIRDSIDPFLSHADNKIYDSKSHYYKALKEQNFEIVGNEELPEKEFEFDEKKLKIAILLAFAEHGLIDISQLSDADIASLEDTTPVTP